MRIMIAKINETRYQITHPDPEESYSARDAADLLYDGGYTARGDIVEWIGSDLYDVTRD